MIVYYPRGKNHPTEKHGNHQWHTYKLPNKDMYKILTHTSALAEPGMIVENGKLRRRTPAEFKKYVEEDTNKCIEWFQKYFGGANSYAYPFFQSSEYLNQLLKKNKVKEIYGQRTDYYKI